MANTLRPGRLMKVLVLTRYERAGASSRLRFFDYEPYFNQAGLSLDIRPFFEPGYIAEFNAGNRPGITYLARQYLRRLKELLSTEKYACLWIEKEVFPCAPGFI